MILFLSYNWNSVFDNLTANIHNKMIELIILGDITHHNYFDLALSIL